MYVTGMRRVGVALALGALMAACKGGDKASQAGAGADTAVPAAAPANTTSTAAAPAPAAPAMADSDIVAMIGLANASEIAAGKSAQAKAKSKDVRAFAAQMVKDHQAMQKSADSLTKATPALVAKGTAKADSAKTAMKASSDSLAAAKGAAFDSLYIAQQIAAHQKVLQDLQNFQNTAQDAGLKTLIQGAIPRVQDHLQKAQQIQSSLGASTTASADTAKKK